MSTPRDHHGAFARRDQRAQVEGFHSYADKRRHGGATASKVRNDQELERLPPEARRQRQRAIRAIAESRSEGLTLENAARRNQTTVDAMVFWSRGSITPKGDVLSADRLWRPMKAIDATTRRVVPVDVRGSIAASRLSDYWAAIAGYLHTGDVAALRAFQGERIAGVRLETDPDVIDYLARLGQLSFETIYRDVAA